MDMHSLIAKRRDGVEHTQDELRFLAQTAAKGSAPDYQLAAWLMAAYLRELGSLETAWLTMAMAETGERVDLAGLPKPWVDKHSTGGVGDKTTLVVLPILAACGLTVVKMSGRGLGITGGTVDKLESVPGFRMDLTPAEMKAQAEEIGIAITGQTANLAPADGALYALRDATATVESTPLIVSSILSKKIAGGAEMVSLDVKCGSGAFMKTFQQANHLAGWLKGIGEQCGLKVHVVITDMDQPLGSAVGNALEVREAIQVMTEKRVPPTVARFRALCLELCAQTLLFSGKLASKAGARTVAEDALMKGKALAKAKEWFAAQGANPALFDEPDTHLPSAPIKRQVAANLGGHLAQIAADAVGRAVIDLGGGRRNKGDRIDPAVGVEVHAVVGDEVTSGQALFTIHASSDEAALRAEKSLQEAVKYSEDEVTPHTLVLGTR
ncbi:MAG: pyrimidine-nucleoside phosphorylase [Fimbriimonadaceae bacterium]|jgi:pyrimidine-nucleoside phosphorylase|nr:pyrimidine-nucleoside phosphorylase [Fimbriimonadaceae bacterium]